MSPTLSVIVDVGDSLPMDEHGWHDFVVHSNKKLEVVTNARSYYLTMNNIYFLSFVMVVCVYINNKECVVAICQ